jgi:3-oxoacyl-[acyl-carrier-protein] synthase II
MRAPEATWITGIGAGTPLGWDYATNADNLLAGKSGIKKIDSFAVSQHPSQIAGVLDAIPCPPSRSPDEFSRLSRLVQLNLWCCEQALRDAGLWAVRSTARIGLIVGIANESGWTWEDDARKSIGSAICDPANDSVPLLHRLRQDLQISGPLLTQSAACASGNFALAIGKRWLELGWADYVIAGGCDTAVTPMTLASFGNLRAVSRQNDRPQQASRPFDKARDGFVLSEGGTVFILERASMARRRKVHAYGELAGCAMTSDAYHPVIPAPDPTQVIAAMRAALVDARVDRADIDYVNAHGTGTPVGDAAEAKALQAVFGERTMQVPVSSTKSMTGHLITAAASIEALACLATFERSAIPPTINLDDPDPECALCHVPHRAREQTVRIAMSNSFGFGGSNSCAIFRAI